MSEAETIEHEADDEGAQGHADAARATIEAEARRQGWRPKEEFSGTAAWVDAEEFIERGKQLQSILRRENREQAQQIAELTKRAQESSEVFKEFRDHAAKTEERAYARALREIEARQAAAVATGDMPEFNRTKAEIAELEAARAETRPAAAPAPVNTPAAVPQPDPYIETWVGANPWFKSDPDAADFAKAVNARLDRDQPGISLRDNLAEVRRQVAKRFPEHFGNPRRDAPSAVGSSQNGSGRQPKKDRGYDDLPADAKKACDRFVKQGLITREDYVKTYVWE